MKISSARVVDFENTFFASSSSSAFHFIFLLFFIPALFLSSRYVGTPQPLNFFVHVPPFSFFLHFLFLSLLCKKSSLSLTTSHHITFLKSWWDKRPRWAQCTKHTNTQLQSGFAEIETHSCRESKAPAIGPYLSVHSSLPYNTDNIFAI